MCGENKTCVERPLFRKSTAHSDGLSDAQQVLIPYRVYARYGWPGQSDWNFVPDHLSKLKIRQVIGEIQPLQYAYYFMLVTEVFSGYYFCIFLTEIE